METNEEEQEQAIVTSSSSPNSIVDALDKFNEKPENERALTPELEQIISDIAKTGYSRHPWEKVKPVLIQKLVGTIDQFNAESEMDKIEVHPNIDHMTFDEMKSDIVERIQSFENAPFTIQRLCELILLPKAHYRRIDKFMRGLNKCVSVVTMIDNEGNKIYVEPSRNSLVSSELMESTDTPSNSQSVNGFSVPHSVIDSDSVVVDSQAVSIGNSQLEDEMEQDNNDNETEDGEPEEEEEEEDKPSSSSSPTTNLTDENSSSSNSNSAPIPSSSTEDMLDQ